MFAENLTFFQAIKFLCDIADIDYYSVENEEDVPESIKMVWLVNDLCINEDEYVENTTITLLKKQKTKQNSHHLQ